jgi:hypothetical protein
MALGAILGVGQALFGGISAANAAADARREQRILEKRAATSPLQKESPELAQFYKQAESRYQENPFTTPYYLETVKQGDRAAANALGAMQTRGAALGSVGRINQILADTKNRGIAGAVQNKNAQFSQYGQAAQARAAEQNRLFNVNQQAPYERMLQLQQMKTQAANERTNAYQSMAVQGLSNAGQYLIAKEMYGQPKTKDNYTQPRNPISGYQQIQPATRNVGYKDYTNMTAPTGMPSWYTGRP